MDTQRFAPPVAAVADIDRDVGAQPVRVWPPSGRMGRLRLLSYSMGLYLLFILLTMVLGAVTAAARTDRTIVGTITIVAAVIYGIVYVTFLVQRSHDMDLSGWWTLLAFIPLVGLVWIFKPGTQGANRWGLPPPPNTWGVRILALLLPGIAVVGIVAAIALPAYSDYAKRAHAQSTR